MSKLTAHQIVHKLSLLSKVRLSEVCSPVLFCQQYGSAVHSQCTGVRRAIVLIEGINLHMYSNLSIVWQKSMIWYVQTFCTCSNKSWCATTLHLSQLDTGHLWTAVYRMLGAWSGGWIYIHMYVCMFVMMDPHLYIHVRMYLMYVYLPLLYYYSKVLYFISFCAVSSSVSFPFFLLF